MAVVFQDQLSHFQHDSNEWIVQIVYNNQDINPTKAANRL
jgi:hypothetical protein